MSNVIVLKTEKTVSRDMGGKNCGHIFEKIGENGSLFLIAAMFILGSIVAFVFNIPIKGVMNSYSYDVLVILVVMELFTNLIAQTGIMQLLAISIAELSKGQKRLCLILFGAMMFLVSSFLNNITAVMLILPIVFVLLITLEADRKYISTFFAAILALSNLGGSATPIGDFPAIIIMTSGITDFISYLTHSFPIAAITAMAVIVVWSASVKKEKDDGAVRSLAISNLKSQYKHIKIRSEALRWLGVVFAGMFIAWSLIPQEITPPEIIAVLGYAVAMVICSAKKIKVEQRMDLKSVLTIASFLFCAQVISNTGILSMLAAWLQNNISDPKLLVMTIMIITSVISGIFSAGPAAAAMMPVIIELCKGSLASSSEWVAVAYAAAICAGSSMFMWSATAGFILSGKVSAVGIEYNDGNKISWGVGQYMKYGFVNYGIQLSIALVVIAVVL